MSKKDPFMAPVILGWFVGAVFFILGFVMTKNSFIALAIGSFFGSIFGLSIYYETRTTGKKETNMRKSVSLIVVLFVAAMIMALSACSPRAYCFNEPTIGPDGRAVNHVECVSPGSPGQLG